jgi:hypothetical protein
MLIYKFRVALEDNDDFLREIEIKPNQTFEDFHNQLMSCISLTKGEMASFFLCDSKWRRQQEITLIDFSEGADAEVEASAKTVLMSKTQLKDIINSPNEKLIYIYDFLKMYTFFIELYKIYSCDDKIEYPRCVKSVSDIPKTMASNSAARKGEAIPEESDDEFAEEFDESELENDEKMFDDIYEDPNSND